MFALETTGPSGCAATGAPNTVNIGLFDGGVGTATWQGQSPMALTRSGCQYVGPYSTSSSTIEFTYDAACNVLRGRVQAYDPSCAQTVWFDVVGRKP